MKLLNALIVFALMSIVSCSRTADGCSNADIEAARAAGIRDARKALAADSASFERDGAVLDIRARETRLREAGFNIAADAYTTAAENVLRNNGIIQ